MNDDLKIFIKNKSNLKESAQSKLKLLLYGVQDNAQLFEKFSADFKEEHYAYDNGNWGVDKNRLTPTEVVLPGGIVSKLHIRADSKLTLRQNGDLLIICENNREISEFKFLHRPNFWNHVTSNGTPTKRLAQMYGLNCLNFNIYSGCEFHNKNLGCQFCSVKTTVTRNEPVKIKKTASELAEICELATKYDDINYIIITGGSYLDSDIEFENHMEVIRAIKNKLPWKGKIIGNVSMMPPKSKNKLIQIYESGISNPSFNMEVWPRKAFEKICPGKNHYVGYDHVVDSLMTLVKYYGSGEVWSNFVAGLVPLKDLKDGFSFMAERGIVPGANIYHPEVGSLIGKNIELIDAKYVLNLYSHAAELYYKYNYKPFFNYSVLRNSLANEVYEGLL